MISQKMCLQAIGLQKGIILKKLKNKGCIFVINCRRTIKVEKCLKHKKEELTIAEAFISTPMAKFQLQ